VADDWGWMLLFISATEQGNQDYSFGAPFVPFKWVEGRAAAFQMSSKAP